MFILLHHNKDNNEVVININQIISFFKSSEESTYIQMTNEEYTVVRESVNTILSIIPQC